MFFGFRSRKPRVRIIPAGERIYAIGDIHGRADLLVDLLDRIDRDHAARSPARRSLIFLGDLVDRGPGSAQAVDIVRDLCARGEARLLKGNHEEIFVAAARGDPKAARALVAIGGMSTIESYGIAREEAESGGYTRLGELLLERIPREHVDFLADAEDSILIGDDLFVHAGIKPGVAIDQQRKKDMRWIRDEFLNHKRDHGVMVVHGHTVREEIDERDNRIGIDTGAFTTGILTAIGLENDQRWYLQSRIDGLKAA